MSMKIIRYGLMLAICASPALAQVGGSNSGNSNNPSTTNSPAASQPSPTTMPDTSNSTPSGKNLETGTTTWHHHRHHHHHHVTSSTPAQ